MSERHVVIPIFIPHEGCPFDCIYCNQKSISGQTEKMTPEKMRGIVEAHLASIREGTFVEIGFYGGSFTGIDRDEQIWLLREANRYIETGSVRELRLSTRPDYINEEILGYLKAHRVGTIELGVQSLDEEVLRLSCRGHGVDDVVRASRLIRHYRFKLGIQTMIGLPGDTAQRDIKTALEVVKLEPDVVRIYPALVIKGTYMQKMYENGTYRPLELEEAVETCSQLLEIYESNNIRVIRIGLQPTEEINEHGDVIAGPYHPAFRQLVAARLMRKRISGLIEDKALAGLPSITVHAHASEISNVVGQKRENITWLEARYGIGRVKTAGDGSKQGNIYISV